MSRRGPRHLLHSSGVRRLQLLLLPVAAVGLLVGATRAGASEDEPATVTPTTTVTSTAGSDASTTTLPGSSAPTSTLAPVSAPPRAGSAIGDLAKGDSAELWSARQMATVIAAAVGALAVLGYAYGRIRSYGT